jgi:hypothetical protein
VINARVARRRPADDVEKYICPLSLDPPLLGGVSSDPQI